MTTTSYSVLPFITPLAPSNSSDPYQRRNQDFYGSNIETSTVHPYQTSYGSHIPERQRPNYSQKHDLPSKQTPIMPTDPQQSLSTGFGQNNPLATNNQKPPQKNNINDPQTIKRSTTQAISTKTNDTQATSTKNQVQKHHSKSPQSIRANPRTNEQNLVRSERQLSQNTPAPNSSKTNISNNQKRPARNLSPVAGQKVKNDHQMSNNNSELTKKPAATVQAQKLNKSSIIRAAAIKKSEAEREQKRNDAFFPSSQNKVKKKKEKGFVTTPETDYEDDDGRRTRTKKIHRSHSYDRHPHTDGERSDSERRNQKVKHHHHHHHHHHHDDDSVEREKVKPKGKHPHSVPKTHQHHDESQSDNDKGKPKQKKNNGTQKLPEKQRSGSDIHPNNHEKSKIQKNHKSRRDDHHEKQNDSSDDEQHHRSKSRKRHVNSDSNAHLPAIRQNRATEGHPELGRRGRHPYYDEYYPMYEAIPTRYDLHRHLYEDAYNVPPYLAPYHDAYDPFFDYEKRKKLIKKREKNDSRTDKEDHENGNGYETDRENRTRSQQSRKSQNEKAKPKGRKSRNDNENRQKNRPVPSYYPDDDVLDLWRQERNDYLKKKFKPTVHDVLYAQQWMKADSYVENQRRRNLRDSQGYYFPYKKYTLKDYKDIQKLNLENPYGEGNEQIIDRREKARKRQEYGQQVERSTLDNPGIRQIPPQDFSDRPPWHVNNAELTDAERISKREKALEYAREQVKYRPINGSQQSLHNQDESQRYGRSRAAQNDRDHSYEGNSRRHHQSYDDYDE